MLNQLKSIEGNLSPQEICKIAGLDYEIEKLPLHYFKGENHQEIEDKFVVVAKDKVFGICSQYWEILQNIDIITTAYESFKELGLKISRVGEFGNGKKVVCVANWDKTFDIKNIGDIVSARVVLIGSHEVGIGHSLNIYYERLVCTNGMTEPVRVGRKVYNHSENAIKALSNALNSIDVVAMNFQDKIEQLTDIPISYEQAMLMLIKEFGNPQKC